MKALRSLGVVALLMLGGCSSPEATRVIGEIPPGAFGLVGNTPLSLQLLSARDFTERNRQAQGVVRDELFRHEVGALRLQTARATERGVLARELMETLANESRDKAPVTEEQLNAEYQRRWLDYDRPRAVRTVQVLFRVPPMAPDEEYRELAEKVHEAVLGSHNLREFANAAKQVVGKEKVEVYELPPLAADGRVIPLRESDRNVKQVDPAWAKAASALGHAGAISDVVGSSHGYHIFFATEVIPEQRKAKEDVREELIRSVLAQRVQSELDDIVRESKSSVVRKRDDITRLLTLITEEK